MGAHQQAVRRQSVQIGADGSLRHTKPFAEISDGYTPFLLKKSYDLFLSLLEE